MKQVLLVANPTAQSGRNAERIERAHGLVRAGGVGCELFATRPRGQTIDELRARLDRGGFDVVVAMGGDGTFREVGAALLNSKLSDEIAMGMLPTGTANDQGKSFGLEANEDALGRNVEVLLEGHETRLDAGRVHAKHADGTTIRRDVFFDSAGWGLSARVLHVRNEDRSIVERLGPLKEVYRDQLVYGGAFVKTFLASYVEQDKFTARIVADGEQHVLYGLTDLIVKGTRVYAGAWVFDPTSRHDDGYFEVIPFVGKADWASKAFLGLEGNPLTEEMLNTIGVSHSKLFRAKKLRIALDPHDEGPVPAQIDGEEFPAAPIVEVTVESRAIRLIVPAR